MARTTKGRTQKEVVAILVEILLFSTIGFVALATILIFVVFKLRGGGLIGVLWAGLRGGSLVLQTFGDNTVAFKHYRTPPVEVKFKARNAITKAVEDFTVKVPKIMQTLKGTSTPLHVCPFNSQFAISLNKRKETNFSNKQLSQLGVMNYEAGFNAGNTLRGKIGGMDINQVILMTLFVVGAILVVNAWFTYNIMGVVS